MSVHKVRAGFGSSLRGVGGATELTATLPPISLPVLTYLACALTVSLKGPAPACSKMLKQTKKSEWKSQHHAGKRDEQSSSGTSNDSPTLDAAEAVPLRSDIASSLRTQRTDLTTRIGAADEEYPPRKRAKHVQSIVPLFEQHKGTFSGFLGEDKN